jgi:hypothetical protein
VSKFVTRLKKQPNCTAQIAGDLGLVGAVKTPEDPQTWKPVLRCSFTAGHPVLDWDGKPGARLEIHEVTPTGTTLIDIDDRPDWTDMRPLPPPGTAVVRTYVAIYRIDGARVGQWSDPCEVAVKG